MTTDNPQDDTSEGSAATTSRTGWKLVTLRIPPEMHHEVTMLAGKLQFTRGKNVSVNALINEAIEQFIKRHKNPKMLRDFSDIQE